MWVSYSPVHLNGSQRFGHVLWRFWGVIFTITSPFRSRSSSRYACLEKAAASAVEREKGVRDGECVEWEVEMLHC